MSLATEDSLASQQPVDITESFRFCARCTRDHAKNFYYGLKLLPEPKRSAMFALYAYMRLIDDIADDDDHRTIEQRERELDDWRTRTHDAIAGRVTCPHPVWPAFSQVARQYNLSEDLFTDAIAGQQQDLRPRTFETFAELEQYCYRVAGVVGLASIRIWGFDDEKGGGEKTEQMAIARGVAFQITNILRDLREDAGRSRLYIPREDLEAVGVTERQVLAGEANGRLLDLLKLEIARAESYYEVSSPLESRIAPDSRATLSAMTKIYRELLRKIATDPERVLRERVSLSLASKLRIGWQAMRANRCVARS